MNVENEEAACLLKEWLAKDPGDERWKAQEFKECVSDGDGIDDDASAGLVADLAVVRESVGEGKERDARDFREGSTVIEGVAVGGFGGTLAQRGLAEGGNSEGMQ
jgi:hypothetical protein